MAGISVFTSTTAASNAASFKALTTTVAAFGTPEALASLAIPAGNSLVVLADKTNTGILYVADSAANAADPTKRISLNAGESASFMVANRSSVWIDSSVASQKALSIVESA